MKKSLNELEQRIKKVLPQLTKSQKKVASYVIENPLKFALSSVRMLESELNVSKTTIIRLAQALGYSGFQEIRSLLLLV